MPYGADHQAVATALITHLARRRQLALAELADRLAPAIAELRRRIADAWERLLRWAAETSAALERLFGYLPAEGQLVRHHQSHKVAEVVALDGGVAIVRRPGARNTQRWPLARITRWEGGKPTAPL